MCFYLNLLKVLIPDTSEGAMTGSREKSFAMTRRDAPPDPSIPEYSVAVSIWYPRGGSLWGETAADFLGFIRILRTDEFRGRR